MLDVWVGKKQFVSMCSIDPATLAGTVNQIQIYLHSIFGEFFYHSEAHDQFMPYFSPGIPLLLTR